jgi:hypothetical protein
MINKLRIATIGITIVSLLVPVAAFAQGEGPEHRIHATGEITGVVPGQGTFTLMTPGGEELEFQTEENTKFRSPDGSIEDIHDLKRGMKAIVIGMQLDDGTLLAKAVGAGFPEDLPEHIRVAGVIESVNTDRGTLDLQPREGDLITFNTSDRTRFRGEGIESLADLEPGMHAMVVAIEPEEGGLLALLVAARKPKDRPDLIKVGGEITGVVPGQGTFSLMTRDGRELEFSTNERTRFRSKDGSIQDIHDLKKGMLAFVGAVETDDGLLALIVAVGQPEDRPQLDVRAGGEVVEKGASSFTLQKRDGETISFNVGENTRYAGIGSFDELEIGMMAAVGAKETDDGLLAVFVGAREKPTDRPQRDSQDRPEGRPERDPFRSPDQPPQDEVSA